MRLRVASGARLTRFVLGPAGRFLIVSVAILSVLGLGVFTYYYSKYSRLIDQKLRTGPFANTAKIYAAPKVVALGDAITPAEIAADLKRTGYNDAKRNPMGWYRFRTDGVEN